MTINLSSTMNNSSKQSKVYQIAVQLAQYESQQNRHPISKHTNHCNSNNTYRLPKIVDVDQDEPSSRNRKSPFKNIFNNIENDNHMKMDQLTNQQKSYNIVGKKQVKAYLTKIVKKRNAYQRRNQSALSLSRYSSSVKSQNQNNLYLNKQDVLSFIKPINNQQITRNQQTLTLGTCKSSKNQNMYSLRKTKDVYDNYTKTWDKQKMKKLKFPSILDHISKYRLKVEYLQNNSLIQQKLHTKNKVWMQTLRTQKNVENYYDDKYVQKIINNTTILNDNNNTITHLQNFSLRGKDKLQKQMQWIDQKDKAGYTFAFVDGFSARMDMANNGKYERQMKTGYGKEERVYCGESQVNRVSNSMQKSKEQCNNVKLMVRNQSMCDMKSILKGSSTRQSQIPLIKQSSQPAVMSQFSNTSQIRNKPNMITSTDNKQSQKRLSRLRL